MGLFLKAEYIHIYNIYIHTYKPNYHSDVPCFCWLSHVPIVVGETQVFLVEQKGC